jgi:hypothetical protein
MNRNKGLSFAELRSLDALIAVAQQRGRSLDDHLDHTEEQAEAQAAVHEAMWEERHAVEGRHGGLELSARDRELVARIRDLAMQLQFAPTLRQLIDLRALAVQRYVKLAARIVLEHDTNYTSMRIPFQVKDVIVVEKDGEMWSYRQEDVGFEPLREGFLSESQAAEIRARLDQWEGTGFPAPHSGQQDRFRLQYKGQAIGWGEGVALAPELHTIVHWLNQTIATMPVSTFP